MYFVECAICGVDETLANSIPLESCLQRINLSGIKEMFDDLTAPLTDATASKFDRYYAEQVNAELKDGLLKYATHVCPDCLRQLPKVIKRRQKAVLIPVSLFDNTAAATGCDDGGDGGDDDSDTVHCQ